MTIYDLIQYLCYGAFQWIQIYGADDDISLLYEGTAAKMPEQFEAREVLSIEATSVCDMGVLVINIE